MIRRDKLVKLGVIYMMTPSQCVLSVLISTLHQVDDSHTKQTNKNCMTEARIKNLCTIYSVYIARGCFCCNRTLKLHHALAAV